MSKNNLSVDQINIIKNLSTTIVREVAPDEAAFVNDAVDEFLDQSISMSQSQSSKNPTFEVSFDPQVINQVLASPVVIAAVISGLFKVVEIMNSKTKEKNLSPALKNEKNSRASPSQNVSPKLTPTINYPGLDRELIDLMRANGIGADRARRIAQAFISLIAKDPSIVVKFSED